MKILISLLFLVLCLPAHADWMMATNTGFHSSTDGNSSYKFSDMINHVFVGASIGTKAQLFIGQNVTYQTTTFTTSTTSKITTLELGPRINYYFNNDKTILMVLAWNPYAKGSRTTVTGASQDVSGYSFLAGLGYEIKLNRNFYLGASIMYYSLTVTKSETNNTSTEVSEAYSIVTPMINMSFRFR